MSRKKFINAKLKSVNELQEILTDHGVFQEISPRISRPDCEIIDLQGKLILPPYVDPIFILITYLPPENRGLQTEQVLCLKESKGGAKQKATLL